MRIVKKIRAWVSHAMNVLVQAANMRPCNYGLKTRGRLCEHCKDSAIHRISIFSIAVKM